MREGERIKLNNVKESKESGAAFRVSILHVGRLVASVLHRVEQEEREDGDMLYVLNPQGQWCNSKSEV